MSEATQAEMNAPRPSIDPSLPHLHVREFLATATPGRRFDERFAELVELPSRPAYSTDLAAIIRVLQERGWWWHLSHIQASVIPTTPAPGFDALLNNGTAYDREGSPIAYETHNWGDHAFALCVSILRATYDLPDAYFVVASHCDEVRSREPLSSARMMAYYRQKEKHRREAIANSDTNDVPLPSPGGQ